MEDQQSKNESEIVEEEKEKGILSYDNDEQQSLFNIFGFEMTAPKGLKNPRIVYISFIVVNLIILLVLKNLLSN